VCGWCRRRKTAGLSKQASVAGKQRSIAMEAARREAGQNRAVRLTPHVAATTNDQDGGFDA
jgi:hypothetical protein